MYIGCNSSWRAGSKPILIKKYILYCFLLCATDLTWLMLLMKIWYFEITASAQQRQSTRFFHENDHPRLPDLLCMCECELHSQVQCILSPWYMMCCFHAHLSHCPHTTHIFIWLHLHVFFIIVHLSLNFKRITCFHTSFESLGISSFENSHFFLVH